MTRPPALIASLDSSEDLLAGRVGGKGAASARIHRLGMTGPPGVTVSVDAFASALAQLSVEGALGGPDGIAARADTVRNSILVAPVGQDLVAAIALQWRRWNQELGHTELIIRSSATVEDSSTHSFAGIFESIRVEREELLEETIRKVWSSAFTDRALAYYELAGLREVPAMALLVQPFLPAERSGVMFTSFDGNDGEDRLLIEHVEGDCEKLVTGAVDPERLLLTRGAALDARTEPLPKWAVVQLLDAATVLEAEFGHPQDVEWLIRDGQLFILQSRPITSALRSEATSVSVEDWPAAILSGLGASGGQAAGAAHLVFHLRDADRLIPGQVLVTPMTNPDMVPAMRNSAAIVTDVGGMICHAAIVSRELGIPCVVGTGTATTTVSGGDEVSVDGFQGTVHPGLQRVGAEAKSPLTWSDLWQRWQQFEGAAIPIVSTVAAIEALPSGRAEILLDPLLDLTLDSRMYAVHLPGLEPDTRAQLFADYVARLDLVAERSGVDVIRMHAGTLGVFGSELAASARDAKRVVVTLDSASPESTRLGAAGTSAPEPNSSASQNDGAVFGTPPAMAMAPMPPTNRRQPYRNLLPALDAAHTNTAGTPPDELPWLNPRPEIVITPLLKSVVLGGLETIPATMGFDNLEPMHVQWITCRFHFRADTMGPVLQTLMGRSWDADFMADLLARSRRSYDRLSAAHDRFPADAHGFEAVEFAALRTVLVEWWQAFVDFFALTFFIQAQGDDCMAPFMAAALEATTELGRAAGMADNAALPGVAELVAPTEAVITSQYMHDLFTVKRALDEADSDQDETVRSTVSDHLDKWKWMRERDPFFEPYDTAPVVIERARAANEAPSTDYTANAVAARLALSFHYDLIPDRNIANQLVYAVGHHHHLALERENHHLVWLRCSYRFRLFLKECEARLRAVRSDLNIDDIFFFELPELIAAMEALPRPPDGDLLARAHNRRAAYHQEARLQDTGPVLTPQREVDYY